MDRQIDDALRKFQRQEIDGKQLMRQLKALNPEWYETTSFSKKAMKYVFIELF